MKKSLVTLFLVSLSVHCMAQISFEKGYYINNSGEKINCFIKNVDWKDNPANFQYKLTKTSEKQTISITQVKAFEILNAAKYERFVVDIDMSKSNVKDLDSNSMPRWANKELFLKVLLQGDVSLYSYVRGNMRRYFVKKKDEEISQLVYKKYLASSTRIAENTQYKRQLWDLLKCGDIPKKVKKVIYTKKSLIKIIKTYNTCKNGRSVDYVKKVKRKPLNISVKPGINFASIGTSDARFPENNLDFEDQVGFQLGVEFEYVFGFNRNKWAFVVEPTYVSSYSDDQDFTFSPTSINGQTTNVTVDYSAIEIPLGFRHYMFLNDSSKLFINAFYMLNFALDGTLKAERSELLDDDISPKGNLAFGIGYKFKNKYSVEFRYRTPRELYKTSSIFGIFDYNSFAIVFGYTLF